MIADPNTIPRQLQRTFPPLRGLPYPIWQTLKRLERAERVRVRQVDDSGEIVLAGVLENIGADPDRGDRWIFVSLDNGGRYVGEADGWEIEPT